MNIRNGYSGLQIALHWILAAAVIALFALGLWMTDLGYYDPWYRKAPDLHKSVGFVVVLLMLFRLLVRLTRGVPAAPATHRGWERRLAALNTGVMYLLVLLLFPSGYLISTADGRALEIFGLISLPALITGVDNLEDVAGKVHEIIAFALIGLVVIHLLAALKHHFIDRDNTLRRMLGRADPPAPG